jgi:hypothetical protein
LLSEAKRSRTLKVILTTREYILAEARRLYERLSGPELEAAKCIVTVEHYTRGRRARILYNHVYFSTLPCAYVRALLRDRSYRKVIDHPNYSPRIIEWMTTDTALTGVPPDKFPDAFVAALDNPTRIWEHALENQLGDDAQYVLLCLATISGRIGHDDLRHAWETLVIKGTNAEPTIAERKRFVTALKQLDGSFVRTTRSHAEIVVEFHNPSIRDFVSRRLAGEPATLAEIVNSAPYFEQVSCLLRLNGDGHVARKPAGVLPDGAIVRSAIGRTLVAPSPLFHSVRNRTGGEWLARDSANVGGRLSEAAEWSDSFANGGFLEFVCGKAAELVSLGHIARVATVEACKFVAAVVSAWPPAGGTWSALVTAILGGIGEEVANSSCQDWLEWTRFTRGHRHLFDANAAAAWTERAQQLCEDEIEAIRHNADTAGEAESWLDEVKKIARYWNIDLKSEIAGLHDRLDELADREDGQEDWDGERYSGRDTTPMGSADAQIDHLFSSLEGDDDV